MPWLWPAVCWCFQAPAKPRTPYGQMLEYMLKSESPTLFKSAVDDQWRRLKEEKDAKEAQQQARGGEGTEQDQAQLVLYK